jgi:uncharacterized protein YdbL (DUF1318 family)
MCHRQLRPRALAALVLAALAAVPASAADRMAQLQEQFKQRYQSLLDLKAQALAGESWTGYVEAVGGAALSDAQRAVVAEENRDRTELYQIIARQSDTTPERVGRRNALRSFAKARPVEKLKGEDNRWRLQPDHDRWVKLRTLMASGTVGETADGLVAFVKQGDGGDPAVVRLLEQENAYRARQYRALAEKDETAEAAIIRREAQLNFRYARPGTFLRDAAGRWQQKEGPKDQESEKAAAP